MSEEIFELEENIQDIGDRLGHVEDVLNDLVCKIDNIEFAKITMMTVDKFDIYMRNLERANGMVNELKGCISAIRAETFRKQDS